MKGWPKGKPNPWGPNHRARPRFTEEQWRAAFMAKVVIEPNGCWRWTGTLSGAPRADRRYGYVHRDGRMQPAHRAFWESLNGPVPVGRELDHLCRNRPCVNPTHLEPVTRLENMLRGELGARWRAARARRAA